MNEAALKLAEQNFLKHYPGGFLHPEMVALGKKHGVEQLTDYCQLAFAAAKFDNPEQIINDAIVVVSRSSLVSRFEKPKFKQFASALRGDEAEMFSDALFDLLHSDQQQGFEALVEQLATVKLAKWVLLSVIGFYFSPSEEVFIKPTTCQGIINALDLDLQYTPRPNWPFYLAFRALIQELKSSVAPELSPNNAAFTGFLMMSLPAAK